MKIPIGTVVALTFKEGINKFFKELTWGEICRLKVGATVWIPTQEVDDEMTWPSHEILVCTKLQNCDSLNGMAIVDTRHGSILSTNTRFNHPMRVYRPLDAKLLTVELPRLSAIFKSRLQPARKSKKATTKKSKSKKG